MKFLYRAFAVLTNSQSIRKKLFVGYSLYRDSMCLNLIPIKARFSISKSGYVKNSNRGAMLIEFIPFSEDPMDPNKKILALKSKKIISLADNHIFKLVTFTEKLLELNRNNKFDEKTLYISKKDLEFK